jgi:hypothetical protein
LSCHEDLYYLHDTGKWYCITEHADRCTNCHDGQEPAPNQEEARLAQFASLGGFKTIHETVSYVPAVSVETGLAEPAGTSRLVEALPWAIGGIFVFGFWLILVLLSPMKP